MMHVQDRSVGPARDRERDRLPDLVLALRWPRRPPPRRRRYRVYSTSDAHSEHRDWWLAAGQGWTPALTRPPGCTQPPGQSGVADRVQARRARPGGRAASPAGHTPSRRTTRPTGAGCEHLAAPTARSRLRWHDRRTGRRSAAPGLVKVREAAGDVQERALGVGVPDLDVAHLAGPGKAARSGHAACVVAQVAGPRQVLRPPTGSQGSRAGTTGGPCVRRAATRPGRPR